MNVELVVVPLVPEQITGTSKELSAPITGDDAHGVILPLMWWFAPDPVEDQLSTAAGTLACCSRSRPYRSGVPKDAHSRFGREVVQLPDGRRQTFYSTRKTLPPAPEPPAPETAAPEPAAPVSETATAP